MRGRDLEPSSSRRKAPGGFVSPIRLPILSSEYGEDCLLSRCKLMNSVCASLVLCGRCSTPVPRTSLPKLLCRSRSNPLCRSLPKPLDRSLPGPLGRSSLNRLGASSSRGIRPNLLLRGVTVERSPNLGSGSSRGGPNFSNRASRRVFAGSSLSSLRSFRVRGLKGRSGPPCLPLSMAAVMDL